MLKMSMKGVAWIAPWTAASMFELSISWRSNTRRALRSAAGSPPVASVRVNSYARYASAKISASRFHPSNRERAEVGDPPAVAPAAVPRGPGLADGRCLIPGPRGLDRVDVASKFSGYTAGQDDDRRAGRLSRWQGKSGEKRRGPRPRPPVDGVVR